MINPGGIPQYVGDFDKVTTAVTDLRKYAIGIKNAGEDVHSRFQATAAYYKAPEADQLLSSTQPVMDTADTFSSGIESLADALETFVAEAKPHADRLEQLKRDAITFVDKVEGDDDWTEDQDNIDAHQALMDDVAAAIEGFQEAERNAANKINALSKVACRPSWVADDGTHASNMYGLDADMLKGVKDLPWGSPEGLTYERWSLDWWGHGAKSWAWDGIAKDSIWGSIDGLGTLMGYHGGEARDEAWDGLRRTFVGGYAYGMDLFGQGEHLSDWQRESKSYAKEFGKQFIAYDMWEEDPARAHAVVFFNLITLGAGPAAGVAKLSKGGTLGKTAGTLAKIGDALDPISGSLKAAKALSDLPKVSQVLANVSEQLRIPETKFPDGALDLSDRYRVDKNGNLIPLNPDGTPNTTPAPRESAAADRAPSVRQDDREPVGVGGRAPEADARVGENLPPRAGHGTAGGGDAGGRTQGGGAAEGGTGAARGGDTGRAGSGSHDFGSGAGRDGGVGVGRGGADRSGDVGRGSGGHDSGGGSDQGASGGDGVSPDGGSPDGAHRDSAGADASGALDGAADAPGDGAGAGVTPEIDPSRYGVRADDVAQSHTGPLKPEQEADLRAELGRAKISPADQEIMLRTLRKDPYGAGVAELINRGHLRDVENYEGILKMCKQGASRSNPNGSMVPAAYMALSQATELQNRGISRLGFEFGDNDTPWDLDVYTRTADGAIDYGYQLKDVQSINKIKKVVQSAMGQLEYDQMRHGVAVLDVHQPMSNLTPQVFYAVEYTAKRSGRTVLLRFEDGAITVPPHGSIFP